MINAPLESRKNTYMCRQNTINESNRTYESNAHVRQHTKFNALGCTYGALASYDQCDSSTRVHGITTSMNLAAHTHTLSQQVDFIPPMLCVHFVYAGETYDGLWHPLWTVVFEHVAYMLDMVSQFIAHKLSFQFDP